jgi:hypothetical protein
MPPPQHLPPHDKAPKDPRFVKLISSETLSVRSRLLFRKPAGRQVSKVLLPDRRGFVRTTGAFFSKTDRARHAKFFFLKKGRTNPPLPPRSKCLGIKLTKWNRKYLPAYPELECDGGTVDGGSDGAPPVAYSITPS